MIYPWTQRVWDALWSSPGSIPTALLLAGPKGVGKRGFALELAQALLCSQRKPTGLPCNACSSCRLFVSGSHPDFRLLEPPTDDAPGSENGETASASGGGQPAAKSSRTIGVGQVRELADFLVMSSHLAGHKAVVIEPADRLHPSASNALLKTLEEPHTGTSFILVADRPDRLLATVRSRCFRIDLPSLSAGDAREWLEAKGVEHPEIALAQAGYAPLAAEQLQRTDFWSRRRALTDLLADRDVAAAQMAAKVAAEDLPFLCQVLYRWCYDLLSLRLAGRLRYNPDYAKSLQRLADNIDVLRLQDLIKELVMASRALEHPLNARLVIERLAIRYTRGISIQES